MLDDGMGFGRPRPRDPLPDFRTPPARGRFTRRFPFQFVGTGRHTTGLTRG